MRRDVVAALIQRNAEEFVAHQEWEWEWNHAGLASRLTEEVGALCQTPCVFATCIHLHFHTNHFTMHASICAKFPLLLLSYIHTAYNYT